MVHYYRLNNIGMFQATFKGRWVYLRKMTMLGELMGERVKISFNNWRVLHSQLTPINAAHILVCEILGEIEHIMDMR